MVMTAVDMDEAPLCKMVSVINGIEITIVSLYGCTRKGIIISCTFL
jgi:hypothetical protein